MRLRSLGPVTGLIACFVWLSAYAQHTDKSFTTTSKDCSGVNWSDDMLQRYPTIGSACQSLEAHAGVTYVKFSGTVVRTKNQGRDLTLDLKGGGEVTVRMPEKTKLSMDGRVTPISELQRGDHLNFYVPQNRVAAEFYAVDEPPEAAPAIVAPFEKTPKLVVETHQRLAATLPRTASDLPLLVVSGLLLLCLGAGLTIARLRHR